MSMIIQDPNFTAPAGLNLPVLYRDAILNAGTVLALDFKNTYCYNGAAGAAIAATQTFQNLVVGGAVATATTAFASGVSAGGGLTFDANGQIVTLPAACKLSAGTTRMCWLMWIKIDASQADTTSSVISLGGCDDGTTQQISIDILGTSRNLVRSRIGGNSGASVTAADATVKQVCFEAVISGGQLTINRYIDGVAGTSTGPYTLATLPQPSTNPVLGKTNASGSVSSLGFRGKIYNVQVHNLTGITSGGSQVTAAQIAAADYALRAGTYT